AASLAAAPRPEPLPPQSSPALDVRDEMPPLCRVPAPAASVAKGVLSRTSSSLRRLHHQPDRYGQPVPVRILGFQLSRTFPGERIVFRLPSGFRIPPVSLHPSPVLQPVQRRVKGPLLHL